MSKGQHRFRFDEDTCDLKESEVIASSASENGPREKQGDLMQYLTDWQRQQAWGEIGTTPKPDTKGR